MHLLDQDLTVITFVILEVLSVICNNNGARKNKMSCLMTFRWLTLDLNVMAPVDVPWPQDFPISKYK